MEIVKFKNGTYGVRRLFLIGKKFEFVTNFNLIKYKSEKKYLYAFRERCSWEINGQPSHIQEFKTIELAKECMNYINSKNNPVPDIGEVVECLPEWNSS